MVHKVEPGDDPFEVLVEEYGEDLEIERLKPSLKDEMARRYIWQESWHRENPDGELFID